MQNKALHKYRKTNRMFLNALHSIVLYVNRLIDTSTEQFIWCHYEAAIWNNHIGDQMKYVVQFWKSVQVIEQKHKSNYNRLHFLIYLLHILRSISTDFTLLQE